MAMIVDDHVPNHLDLFDHSTTTTTNATTTTTGTTNSATSLEDDGGHGCKWSDLSPVVDWEALSLSNHQDDFHDLIQSMVDENNTEPNHHPPGSIHEAGYRALQDFSGGSMSSPEYMAIDEEANSSTEDFKGLRLIHLLMAAAEALTGVNKSRELARVILVRLKELVSPTSGTNMERLAAYFTEALQGLLEGTTNMNLKHILNHHHHHHHHKDHHHHNHQHHQTDFLAAFQLLQDMSPYVKFGHFTANQAILEAVTHDRRIHIVDYDIMEGIQWASLMQALVSRKDGRPAPHLRITALSRGGSCGRRSIGTVQETGRRLASFAASINQPFSFHQCRVDSDETFKPSAVKLVKGEALIINCMLHLPHFTNRARDSIASFLSGSAGLRPRLVTLVEEEVGPNGEGGFVGRFMDSLHHYSAMYDSLEAGFPLQGRARALVERVFLGPRIIGSLAQIYRTSGEDEGYSWGQWLGALGFAPVRISFANHCQARLLLGLFNDGYKVEELGSNKLVLGWKSRRLLSASVWTSPDHHTNL